jgi:tetratricopeptide (TPR) repeat protein
LRKALDWALYHASDPLLGLQLVAAGLPLWHELSLGEESRRNCERALAEFDRIGCADISLKLKLVVGLAAGNTYLSANPPETIALFEAAIRLAREAADAGAECRALSALATFTLLPSHQTAVSETLQAMRDVAIRTHDRPALWEYEQLRAHWEVLLCEFPAAHARLESLRAEMRHHSEGAAPRFQVYQKANIEVQHGALCWLMGKPGRAVRVIEEAAREAMEVGHGLTLIHCFSRGVIFTMIECHDYERARFYTERLKDTIYRHGMAAWIPIADCYSEAIEALSGVRPRPERLREAFENLRKATIQLRQPSYYATLANAMNAIGQADDAASVVDHVFEVNPQRWVLPELLRVRAATQAALGRPDEGEATLRESLRVANEIGCLAWKLRSAHDLAALLNDRGAPALARQILAPVCDQFEPGDDSGDLRRSRRLLEHLAESDGRVGPPIVHGRHG